VKRSLACALVAAAAAGAPTAALAAGDPLRPRQWNLDLIEADAAHGISTGVGAIVAVVDTGAQLDHPDLAGRLTAGADLVDSDGTPQDGNGHGTHVAGIVAASSGNGIGVGSVAPGALVMPIRVLGDDGSGDSGDVADGIDRARTGGADVINLSLGAEVPLIGATGGDALDAAIRRALAAGIVVVAAAGNNGVPVCEQPAAAEGLLCVGAVDRRRQRAFFSSFGSGLGLVAPGGSALPAPGEDVLSTYLKSDYTELAGTSQAAPHVAGAAALLVSLGVRGQAATERLLATATDLGAPGADPEYGHGLLNARAALAGLPAPAAAGGGASAATATVRVNRRPTRRAVQRHGLRVKVRTTAPGRVRLRLVARGRTLARGSRVVPAGRTRTVVARLTAAGRARLARGGRVPARLLVRLPGEAKPRVRRVVVR
jgi:subtilisin family serine protease